MMTDLREHFSTLEDPRIDRNKRHELLDIVLVVICGVLSGADGWEAIEEFGKEKLAWLRQFGSFANGVPSHDCIARVISRLSVKGFRACFQSVAVLGMRNGTSQSPFRPALGRQLVRAADAPLRGHGFGTSRLRQTPTTNGLTAYRMRLHLACVSSGTYGPFATSASRSRLRLPRTTRLALRASLAGSV